MVQVFGTHCIKHYLCSVNHLISDIRSIFYSKEKNNMNRIFVACWLLLCVVAAWGGKPTKHVWVIDAGHGAHDWGCGKKPMMEKKITLAVAKEVRRLINAQIPDVAVVFTREGDTYPTLAARADLANRRGAELFVSIHVNEAPSLLACGTETFIAKSAATKGANANKSEVLALLMQKHYLNSGLGTSRGVKKRELYVIEQTRMPSVLTEIGFLSNSADSAVMCSPEGQTLLAQSIVNALKEWKQIARPGVKRRDLINLRYAYQDYRVEDVQPLLASRTQRERQEVQGVQEVQASAEAPADTMPSLCFAIQLMNSSKPIAADDRRLKGIAPTRCIKIGTLYKVIAYLSPTYADARSHLTTVREIFPDAFIVAFRDGQQITVAEAQQQQ